jgi:hypothetical protein
MRRLASFVAVVGFALAALSRARRPTHLPDVERHLRLFVAGGLRDP